MIGALTPSVPREVPIAHLQNKNYWLTERAALKILRPGVAAATLATVWQVRLLAAAPAHKGGFVMDLWAAPQESKESGERWGLRALPRVPWGL